MAQLLQDTLIKQNYQVELAADGLIGWHLAESFTFDLILLDLVLPKLDGMCFCKQLRSSPSIPLNPNRDTPVLLMTAVDTITNKVMGLDAGADDYVVKPFDLEEILARIRALTRRPQQIRTPILTWGELCLNSNNCEVTYGGQSVFLTSKEYGLLELFLQNPDQIFSSGRLLDRLWALDDSPTEGTVRTHIKSLRHKFRQVGALELIETIYKLGYRLKAQPQKIHLEVFPDQKNQPENQIVDHPIQPALSSLKVSPELQDIWLEYRQSYCDRLTVIEAAISALKNGQLISENKHQAEREAHTLIGSLGSFGLVEAAQISRKIQQLLQQEQTLATAEIAQLEQLIAELKQHLQDPNDHNQEINSDELLSLSTSLPYSYSALLLIIDRDVNYANKIAIEAITWGIQTEIAIEYHQAYTLLNRHNFDIIILDLNFSDVWENELKFLANIHYGYPQSPIIILTAEESLSKRIQTARLGSQCFLQKNLITSHQILETVTQILQQTKASPQRLLIVDNDPVQIELFQSLFAPYNYQITYLENPQKFWETLEITAPDLVILETEFARDSSDIIENQKNLIYPLSGFDLCQVIRHDPLWNRLPVLFVSAHTDPEIIQRCFAFGADDFLSKPIVQDELLLRIKVRLEQRKLWKVTEIDALTGVSLRQKALQNLTRLLNLARRQHKPLSLALLDLDLFKQVNDQHGHEMGDYVLSYLGKLLSQLFRQEDVVGRWGGEEFILGMYGATKENAMSRLTKFLHQFRQHQFIGKNHKLFQVTFSAGIAQFPEHGQDIHKLYQAADIALYQAKTSGRNQIFLADMD